MIGFASQTSERPHDKTQRVSFQASLVRYVRVGGTWILTRANTLRLRTAPHFTHHPAETNESYLKHLWFTVKMSLRFAWLGILLFTHGVFPFLFTRTVSAQITRIYLIMRSRAPESCRKAAGDEYDI